MNGALAGYVVRYRAEGAPPGPDPVEESTVPPPRASSSCRGWRSGPSTESPWRPSPARGRVRRASPCCAGPTRTCRGPPRRVEVEVLNSTALRVMWRSLLPGRQHGQIRGYQVHYVRVENGESRGMPLIKDVMLADAQEMIIGGLQPDTTYSITVAAYTTKGDGARSKPKLVVTKGAVPGPPLLLVRQETDSSAVVQWQPPEVVPPGWRWRGTGCSWGARARARRPPWSSRPGAGLHGGRRAPRRHLPVPARRQDPRRPREEAVRELTVPEEAPGVTPESRRARGT
ncbi:hypothetical protein ANANG_G00093400 [Anguilla anguilla]|uniref:Fibronectin type-III domain-containing protein n=1 Tax=Anguilla anguilla TaxID=7936 RepID=A0A9D3MRM7_ANGAN|nr:hypothetical protein ANANG_G00093400 [Anguilla anguilla]